MDKKILREINSNLKFMSTVERKIADGILENPKEFTKLTLEEFSNLSGASQGSIVNFAKKYAKGGFPQLKMEVASCVAIEIEKEHNLKDVGQYKKTVLDVFNNIKIACDNTYAVNEESVFGSVVDKILCAKKVEIYGVYRSAVVANDLYLNLVQMGVPATFVSDVLSCEISASFLDKDSVFIAISISGKTKEVIDAVKIAKDKNVPIICITGNKNSPLAKLSDDVLVATPSGKNDAVSNEVRIAQIALTDALCEFLRKRLKEKSSVNSEVINRILTSHNVND